MVLIGTRGLSALLEDDKGAAKVGSVIRGVGAIVVYDPSSSEVSAWSCSSKVSSGIGCVDALFSSVL
ncbi:hypothetical protein A2U01_0072719, partial [Trifolium medium]|nr:hypothetical protein [Trifolium medium]